MWAHGNDKGSYRGETGGSKTVIDVMVKARDWMDSQKGLQAKKSRWPLKAVKAGKQSLPHRRTETPRNQPANILTFVQ